MEYFNRFLQACSVSVLDAQKTVCWKNWQEWNYTPTYNKFYFILSGYGELIVDGVSYFPKAGELFLMPAGVCQSYHTINSTPYTKHWCHFTAETSGVRLFDAIKVPLCVSVPNQQELCSLFEQLEQAHCSEKPFAALTAQARMLDILHLFLQLALQNGLSFSDNIPAQQLKAITDYIYSNLHKSLSVEQLAAIAHLHPNYFIAFFRRYFGTTPAKYVFVARMERAKILLKTTPQSISSVAEQTGFLGVEHFSRRFKEYTGFSPSDFRKL